MKTNILKYILLITFSILLFFISIGYVGASNTKTYSQFDTLKVNDFKTDPAFDYIYTKKKAFSLSKWLTEIIVNFLKNFIGKENSNLFVPIFFNILKWICVILAILFIIAQVLGIKFSELFTRKQEIVPNLFDEILEENIHELDFEQAIKDNLNKGNYRYVIRLYYLMSLKNLQDKEIIIWQAYKTNKEYIEEIQDNNIRNDFSDITALFNYTWYGNFSIDEDHCKTYVESFKNFNNALKELKIA